MERGRAWQSHKGCIWHKALLKKSFTSGGNGTRKRWVADFERQRDAVLEKGSLPNTIKTVPTVRFLDTAWHVMEEGDWKEEITTTSDTQMITL